MLVLFCLSKTNGILIINKKYLLIKYSESIVILYVLCYFIENKGKCYGKGERYEEKMDRNGDNIGNDSSDGNACYGGYRL